jgi:threonyl-tRNA synthetase
MKILIEALSRLLVENIDRLAYAEPESDYSQRIDESDCILVRITCESGDQCGHIGVDGFNRILRELKQRLQTTGVDSIVVYPWAHGSVDLCSPGRGYNLWCRTRTLLRQVFQPLYAVKSAGFGVKKQHSMTQSPDSYTRYYDLETELSQTMSAVSAEGDQPSRYTVVNCHRIGQVYDLCTEPEHLWRSITRFLWNSQVPDSSDTVSCEIQKKSLAESSSYDTSQYYDQNNLSDSGMIVQLPKLVLMNRLVVEKLRRYIRLNIRVYQVQCPSILDVEQPLIREYIRRFPSTLYDVKAGKKRLALRFAACPNHFYLVKNAFVNSRILPLRVFEIAKSVFRVEKTGETHGLQRLRSFTMPDMHLFTASGVENRNQFLSLLRHVVVLMRDYNLYADCVACFRCTSLYFEQNRVFLSEAVRALGTEVLFELWPTQKYYFQLKFELNSVIDGFVSQLSTIQIDNMYPQLYGVKYSDNTGKHPLHAMHASLTGSIQRVCDALLRKGLGSDWLNPLVQVHVQGEMGEKLRSYIVECSLRIPIQIYSGRKNWSRSAPAGVSKIYIGRETIEQAELVRDYQTLMVSCKKGESFQKIRITDLMSLHSEYALVSGSYTQRVHHLR